MSELDPDALKPWARKYVWWETPEQAVRHPLRVVAQVMDIGDYEDVQELIGRLGASVFRQAIEQAEPGQFNDRSWAYWHHRLGLAQDGLVPPAFRRHFS
ncbi:MAG: hypothetical protein ACREP2_02520 [Rhodanobacteraceae bacterium]